MILFCVLFSIICAVVAVSVLFASTYFLCWLANSIIRFFNNLHNFGKEEDEQYKRCLEEYEEKYRDEID